MLLKACVTLINNFQKSLLIEKKEGRKYCKIIRLNRCMYVKLLIINQKD